MAQFTNEFFKRLGFSRTQNESRVETKQFLFSGNSLESKNNKTAGVINDPLGQTHSLASSENCFLLFCFVRCEKWGRTDNMCENNDPYRPWLWIGRVDQYHNKFWARQCFLDGNLLPFYSPRTKYICVANGPNFLPK